MTDQVRLNEQFRYRSCTIKFVKTHDLEIKQYFIKLYLLSRTKSGLTETESDPGYESDEILFSGKKMENMELLNRGKERTVLRAVDVSLQLPNLPDLSTPLSSLHLRDCRISRIPATLLKIIKHVSLTYLLIYMRPVLVSERIGVGRTNMILNRQQQ